MVGEVEGGVGVLGGYDAAMSWRRELAGREGRRGGLRRTVEGPE